MSPQPPPIGRALLWLTLPRREREVILGDLHEEFVTEAVARLGADGARRWYLRQVVRSLPPLAARRWLVGGAPLVVLIALVTGTLSLLGLEALWAFVYAHIPLKDGTDRTAAILVADTALVALASTYCGAFVAARDRDDRARGAGLAALAVALAVSLAIALVPFARPAWHVASLLLIAPIGAVVGGFVAARPAARNIG